jgi:hypothetical protein
MNAQTSNENVIPKLKAPSIFYVFAIIILFLIIMMFMVLFDVSPSSAAGPTKATKSQEQFVADVFIILFFSLLIVGICVLFLPSLKDFKTLFEQISSTTYVILYTIFNILFYTLSSAETLNTYSYLINPAMFGLGAYSFYKASTDNYIEQFNVNYERIKMLILFFCLITIVITFYNINPGNSASNYFGYSLLITIVLAVFAFLYIVVLMTMPDKSNTQQLNLLSNFSSFGTYGTILFVLFLTIVTFIISSDKANFFANKAKSAGVIILLLLICILWSMLISVNSFTSQTIASDAGLLKTSLLVLFGLIISGLLIFWITYNIENLSGKSSIASFVLNLLLVIVILGLIYKTIFVKLPTGNTKKNAFFNLISATLFYIPCLVSGTFDWFGKIIVGQYHATETGSVMMLGVAIALIVAYLKVPSIFNYISTQGGNQLVNNPVYTDTQYNLGSYQDLNGGSDEFDYQYAISSWIFIDAAGPNTNENYNNFTSLLNFGNKPNILYNGKENTLMITMQQKDLKKHTKHNLTDFDDNGNRIVYINKNILLQKWNNIIINYNGGTMDIFLNGELVKSAIEVVPYYTYDNLTIGENKGIKGGICNVVYFRETLTSQNIYIIYNSLKHRSPPILNDSNQTIMIDNIQQAKKSTESVTNI